MVRFIQNAFANDIVSLVPISLRRPSLKTNHEVTLVTAFFLREGHKTGVEDYLRVVKPLMDIDVPFHVFIDDRLYSTFYHFRDGKQDKTFWCPVSVDKILSSHRIEDIQRFIVEKNFQPSAKNWNASYAAITNSKFSLVRDAAVKNMFETSHFAWIDFGIMKNNKTNGNIIKVLQTPVDNFRIGSLGFFSEPDTRNLDNFYSSNFKYVTTGGFWMASRDNMIRVTTACDNKFREILDKGYCYADEQTIYSVWMDQKEDIDLYVADYDTIFENFHGVTNGKNKEWVLYTCKDSGFLKPARKMAAFNGASYKVVDFQDDGVSIFVPNFQKYSSLFEERRHKESGFRKIISFLMKVGIINTSKNVVDLGAWIGDNTLPWAKRITGKVYAIDPSEENISFISGMVDLNGLDNVVCVQKPISNVVETVYSGNADLYHTYFKSEPTGHESLQTTSLDILFQTGVVQNVGFIHLDVEGMEHKVVLGAQDLIRTCRPVVAFEQHINKDDYVGLSKHLTSMEYDVFIINEILPGCELDCRNFLAIPKEINWGSFGHMINDNLKSPNLLTSAI
jgi:FkbM family methyltransferase